MADAITIEVPVRFRGTVSVTVPAYIPAGQQRPLAEKLALAMVLATVENADAPVEDAANDYATAFELTEAVAGKHVDESHTVSVGGCWELDAG